MNEDMLNVPSYRKSHIYEINTELNTQHSKKAMHPIQSKQVTKQKQKINK